MTLETLLNQVKTAPTEVEFTQVMDVINNHYNYTPSQFSNGDLTNLAGTNEGSCKIFYFAKLNQLTEAQTLHLFGTYYRDDVLKHPEGSDHSNIRNFMKTGWDKISFDSPPLTKQ